MAEENSQQGQSVRVDVWLWSVRACKTRSAATAATRAGHVRVNGSTAKASQPVKIGDEVRLRVQGFDRVLQVLRIIKKRVGAPVAAQCYADVSAPRPTKLNSPAPITRLPGAGRPTKKERRALDALRGRDSRTGESLSLEPLLEQ